MNTDNGMEEGGSIRLLGRRPKPVQEKRRKLSCADTAEDEISDRMQCEINRSSCSKEMSAILRARDNWANAVLSAFLLASGHDLRVPRNRKQDRDLSTGRRQSSMIFARDAASWASFGTSHIVAPPCKGLKQKHARSQRGGGWTFSARAVSCRRILLERHQRQRRTYEVCWSLALAYVSLCRRFHDGRLSSQGSA